MAYTEVFVVHNKLKRVVGYAADPEKTSLDAMIDYALNPDKTEERLFESALNCSSPATAYAEMMATKNRFGKADKVLAYHIIQSFKPGEITPGLAH